MSGNTAKRVVLYRFDRQPIEGFAPSSRFGFPGLVEVMSLDGMLITLEYSEVKAVCFVSETGPAKLFNENVHFERRPKNSGLWVRFFIRDGDSLDGLLPHNLTEWPEAGYLLVPPKASSLRQRVFLPRAALSGTELRGVIGRSASANTAKARSGETEQLRMFDAVPGEI